jgi:hypothetical protein
MTRDEKQTNESVAARIAALKKASLADLRAEWFALFGAAAPVNSRDYLRDRLAYRIQELAFGGLKPATVKKLEAMGERLDGGNITTRRIRADLKPIAGTRLIREWQGGEHTVTVLDDGYEWQGRPYQSLSAVARAITGTRWNGLVFFGLKTQGARA